MSMLRAGSISDIDLLIEIDNDASVLFEHAGLHLDAARDREVTLAARERWLRCLRAGNVLVATDRSGVEIGFAAVGERDGQPYLDQSWNRPFYERHGFAIVQADQCGSELQRELAFERQLLPDPEHRIAMKRPVAGLAQRN